MNCARAGKDEIHVDTPTRAQIVVHAQGLYRFNFNDEFLFVKFVKIDLALSFLDLQYSS